MNFTIQQILSEITTVFFKNGWPDPKRQAENLLCDLLSCSRADLYSEVLGPLTPVQWQTALNWSEQRLRGKPLAYLVGQVEFYACSFEVNPSVLIPRHETEILVDMIVKDLKKQDLRGKKLWDLCCGSGCIGIALKKALPSLTVYLSDYSEKAIEVAVRNAKKNHVEVICLQGDFLNPFKKETTDYFVCNPPYISECDYALLDKEVRDYEPRLALVGGESGLEFYERLASELPVYLNPQGRAWFEIGYDQGEAIKKLFQNPPWKKKKVEKDWAGHDRFFFLEIE